MTREQQLEAALYLVLDLTRDARLPGGTPCAAVEATRQAWTVLGPEARARFDGMQGVLDVEPVAFDAG